MFYRIFLWKVSCSVSSGGAVCTSRITVYIVDVCIYIMLYCVVHFITLSPSRSSNKITKKRVNVAPFKHKHRANHDACTNYCEQCCTKCIWWFCGIGHMYRKSTVVSFLCLAYLSIFNE